MSQHFFFSCLFLLLLACFVCCDENNSLNNSFSSDINSPSLNSADSSNTPSTVTATTTPTSESITSADSNTIATSVSTASTTTPTVVPTPTAGSNRIWANSSKILITETIGTTFGRVSLTIDFTAAIQGINPYSTLITYGLSYTSAESPFEVVNVPIDPKSSPTIAFTSRLSPFTLHSFTLLILNTSSPSPPIWTTVFSYNTTATFPIWSNTTASTTPLLSASSVTNTSATLSWLSPVLLNGPEPLRYTLSYSTKEPNVNGLGPFSTTLTAPFFTNNPVSSSNYTFTSLSPGTLYNFTLTSSNAGPLNRSSKVLSVQLRTSPSIVLWGPDPPSFSTVLANASTLVVFWSAPLYPQDDKATLSYRAFALIKSTTDSAQDTTGDDSFSYCLLSPNNCIEGLVVSSNQTATFTQLTTATSYKIYIIAYNSLNIPAYSPVIYITRTIAGPPSWGDLKTAVATVYNSTHVYIDWSPGISIANDDPDEIRYKVIRLPDRKVVVDYQNTDLTTLSCFDTNLETYRNYTYVIYAKNSGSFSVESSTVSTNPVFISQSSADDGDESVVQSLPFIIGVSVGGAVFLALVIALGVFCRPFKAKPKKRPEIFVDHAFMQ